MAMPPENIPFYLQGIVDPITKKTPNGVPMSVIVECAERGIVPGAMVKWNRILATRKALKSAEANVLRAKSASPLSGQAICEAMDAVEGYQKGLARLESLKTELFS